MKQRKFSNSDRKNEMITELKNDFKPILEKLSVPVTTFAKRNPKKTLLLMIAIVMINIITLFFFTDAFKTKEGSGLTGVKFPELKHSVNNGAIPDIEVSFKNIRKVKAMRDTLNYLMALKQMSFQDTLTFVRVTDEFQKITSGRAGLAPVSLEDLRGAGKKHNITKDTTINK
jgi:ABC-type cobalt transport system substrate-binding protein